MFGRNPSHTGNVNAIALSTEIFNSIEDLNIYPNPFKDETTVDFGREIKEATITIVDVYGKLVEIYNVANQQTHIIKRNNKASGVYFLEIETNNGVINKKLILQ